MQSEQPQARPQGRRHRTDCIGLPKPDAHTARYRPSYAEKALKFKLRTPDIK